MDEGTFYYFSAHKHANEGKALTSPCLLQRTPLGYKEILSSATYGAGQSETSHHLIDLEQKIYFSKWKHSENKVVLIGRGTETNSKQLQACRLSSRFCQCHSCHTLAPQVRKLPFRRCTKSKEDLGLCPFADGA